MSILQMVAKQLSAPKKGLPDDIVHQPLDLGLNMDFVDLGLLYGLGMIQSRSYQLDHSLSIRLTYTINLGVLSPKMDFPI